MIIQKNHQCDRSSKASALVLASFDHSCIKVYRVGTFSFKHTEVFSSAKKDVMKYCSTFFLVCICLNVMKYLFFSWLEISSLIEIFQTIPANWQNTSWISLSGSKALLLLSNIFKSKVAMLYSQSGKSRKYFTNQQDLSTKFLTVIFLFFVSVGESFIVCKCIVPIRSKYFLT